MKTIIIAFALAMSVTGSASAAPRETHDLRNEHRALVPDASTVRDPYGAYIDGQQVGQKPNASMGRDPDGVYIGGKEIGRDPDPVIREQLHDEYYQDQGN